MYLVGSWFIGWILISDFNSGNRVYPDPIPNDVISLATELIILLCTAGLNLYQGHMPLFVPNDLEMHVCTSVSPKIASCEVYKLGHHPHYISSHIPDGIHVTTQFIKQIGLGA